MGGLHSTPGGAIGENMRVEGDQSRGASGGCNQDPGKVPNNTPNSTSSTPTGKS